MFLMSIFVLLHCPQNVSWVCSMSLSMHCANSIQASWPLPPWDHPMDLSASILAHHKNLLQANIRSHYFSDQTLQIKNTDSPGSNHSYETNHNLESRIMWSFISPNTTLCGSLLLPPQSSGHAMAAYFPHVSVSCAFFHLLEHPWDLSHLLTRGPPATCMWLLLGRCEWMSLPLRQGTKFLTFCGCDKTPQTKVTVEGRVHLGSWTPESKSTLMRNTGQSAARAGSWENPSSVTHRKQRKWSRSWARLWNPKACSQWLRPHLLRFP